MGIWGRGGTDYLSNQCQSPLKLWVWNPLMSRCIWYSIMWQSLSVTCDRLVVFSWYSSFSTNKTDHQDVTEILLKVKLNTITLTSNPQWGLLYYYIYFIAFSSLTVIKRISSSSFVLMLQNRPMYLLDMRRFCFVHYFMIFKPSFCCHGSALFSVYRWLVKMSKFEGEKTKAKILQLLEVFLM